VGSLIARSDDGENATFFASDLPLTVDQVRTKPQAAGWAAIQVTRDDRVYRSELRKTAAWAGSWSIF
jgi:hypothetical protein